VQTPQDPIEQSAMGLALGSRVVIVLEVRKQVLNAIPLAIAEFVAMWHG